MSEFMRRAIRLACESVETQGGPFGAVIVHDGAIIAEGMNRVTPSKDPTAHAEMVAIRAACTALDRFDLRGCTIYTSCEPCPMCLGALHWARVERIVYAASQQDAAAAGFDDAELYAEVARPHAERTTPIVQDLGDEGTEPFDAWERHEARVAY